MLEGNTENVDENTLPHLCLFLKKICVPLQVLNKKMFYSRFVLLLNLVQYALNMKAREVTCMSARPGTGFVVLKIHAFLY